MTISFYGKVVCGKLTIVNRKAFDAMLPMFEGKDVMGTIERKKKKRSNPQNAYYWSCIIPIIQVELTRVQGEPVDRDTVHDLLKARFNSKKIVSEKTGEVIDVPESTTKLSTTDFAVYTEDCRKSCAEFLDVDIPLPNEQSILII